MKNLDHGNGKQWGEADLDLLQKQVKTIWLTTTILLQFWLSITRMQMKVKCLPKTNFFLVSCDKGRGVSDPFQILSQFVQVLHPKFHYMDQ
jgi:hypothetical protein